MSQFGWSPSLRPELTKEPRILTAPFGDGYTQRVGDGINNNPQTWQLSFNNIAIATADAIESFLDSKIGLTFTWTPPGKAEISVVSSGFKRVPETPSLASISVKFTQTFGE